MPGRDDRRWCNRPSRATTSTSRKGEIIRCPWHSWEFDIRTGQSWCDPGKVEDAPAITVSVEQGAKLVEGPYKAETFPVSVENQYVVVEA